MDKYDPDGEFAGPLGSRARAKLYALGHFASAVVDDIVVSLTMHAMKLSPLDESSAEKLRIKFKEEVIPYLEAELEDNTFFGGEQVRCFFSSVFFGRY